MLFSEDTVCPSCFGIDVNDSLLKEHVRFLMSKVKYCFFLTQKKLDYKWPVAETVRLGHRKVTPTAFPILAGFKHSYLFCDLARISLQGSLYRISFDSIV
jgi:hypothetical protein